MEAEKNESNIIHPSGTRLDDYLPISINTPQSHLEVLMANEYPREVGAIYDVSGRMKWSPRVGSEWEIAWSEEELKDMRDADVTHSHPDGGTFSASDLITITVRNGRSLRAVGTKRGGTSDVYEILRPKIDWAGLVNEEAMADYYINEARARRIGPPNREECVAYFKSIRRTPLYESIRVRARVLNAYYKGMDEARIENLSLAGRRSIESLPIDVRQNVSHLCLQREMDRIGVEYRRI